MFFPKCYRSLSHYDSDVSGMTPVGLSIVPKSTLGMMHLLPWDIELCTLTHASVVQSMQVAESRAGTFHFILLAPMATDHSPMKDPQHM